MYFFIYIYNYIIYVFIYIYINICVCVLLFWGVGLSIFDELFFCLGIPSTFGGDILPFCDVFFTKKGEGKESIEVAKISLQRYPGT